MKSLFSKYHKGEKIAQQKANEQRQAEFNGQAISNEIIDGALSFISEQEYVVASFADENENVWSTILIGNRGFIKATNKKTLTINLSEIVKHHDDPFWNFLAKKKRIGLVIIELASRRRLRVNGSITQLSEKEFSIRVNESYPNCMKYIQRRQIIQRNDSEVIYHAQAGQSLNESQIEIMSKADTFFIGTNNPKGDMDVSHRGGPPGFIEFINESTIKVPDYQGNSMFNTFGNLMIDNRAGLVFWDFDNSLLLQITGVAVIEWNDKDINNKTNGTGRFWNFHINEWVQYKLKRHFEWELLDYSKYNPK